MNWFRYGPHALLFEFASELGEETFQKSRAILAELERHPPEGLADLVPAFTTVLLEFDPKLERKLEQLAPELARRVDQAAGQILPPNPVIEIPVTYDGPDLERVAQHNRLNIADIPALHAAVIYKVYMLGFAPGFPYLGDLDLRLHTPRLPAPRKRVRSGSVAIGGTHTGIYSMETAGGWNIIGHTTAELFEPQPDDASGSPKSRFLLSPGDRVQFVPKFS